MDKANQNNVKKSTKKISTTGIRVDKETRRLIARMLDKANKKQFGRKVKASHLISLALELVSDEHFKRLQENSLTNADKLEMQYKEYVRHHGSISKDEFFGKLHDLMSGNLSQNPA